MRLKGLGNIPKDAVRFEFGFVKYGFAWAFPLKDSVNIGLGTFINNKLLEDNEPVSYTHLTLPTNREV